MWLVKETMSNWLYSSSSDNRSRFILGEAGENPLVLIGVNPSTADPEHLDNTLRQIKNRAEFLGYDSWAAINLYPQRATDPNDMHRNFHRELHEKNLSEIRKYINCSSHIWAGWGTLIEKRPYLFRCLKDIYQVLGPDCRWFTMGNISAKGHPHHPLYLKKGLKLDAFDIDQYIERLVKNQSK